MSHYSDKKQLTTGQSCAPKRFTLIIITQISIFAFLSVVSSSYSQAEALAEPEPAPIPESLQGRPIPTPSNLSEFVKNKAAAIALGKALFWDMLMASPPAPRAIFMLALTTVPKIKSAPVF